MQRFTLFIPLIMFVILVGFFWRGLSLDPTAMPSALIDKQFPEFTLTNLHSGEKISRADILGQVALVNVWATWCAACKYEHPVLNNISAQGVPIIGLNYKDNSPAALKWLTALGDPYQLIIVDPTGKLGLDLGVFGAPETYLIDKQGVIRYKHVGIVDMQVWNELLKPRYEQYSQ
ncbi:MAG: cytochrome c biogenesis protein CcmG/thiol:disulfide interchange protein DsbE [Candidatus Endobugula sp.]|jgi:cytochrome c biogenesis protein CcmG/thiol:disulfide interchange protein DsbE